MDAMLFPARRRPAPLPNDSLSLFDVAGDVDAPSHAPVHTPGSARSVSPIRLEPQSVPSGSSELGADRARRTQQDECDRILAALATAGAPLSRDDIHACTRIPISNLCARLGPSGPLQVAEWIVATEHAARSASGNLVFGYTITAAGRDRVRGDA